MQMRSMRRTRQLARPHGNPDFESCQFSTFSMNTRGIRKNYNIIANPEYLQHLVILRVVTKKEKSVSIFNIKTSRFHFMAASFGKVAKPEMKAHFFLRGEPGSEMTFFTHRSRLRCKLVVFQSLFYCKSHRRLLKESYSRLHR